MANKLTIATHTNHATYEVLVWLRERFDRNECDYKIIHKSSKNYIELIFSDAISVAEIQNMQLLIKLSVESDSIWFSPLVEFIS